MSTVSGAYFAHRSRLTGWWGGESLSSPAHMTLFPRTSTPIAFCDALALALHFFTARRAIDSWNDEIETAYEDRRMSLLLVLGDFACTGCWGSLLARRRAVVLCWFASVFFGAFGLSVMGTAMTLSMGFDLGSTSESVALLARKDRPKCTSFRMFGLFSTVFLVATYRTNDLHAGDWMGPL